MLDQVALISVVDGNSTDTWYVGIGELDGITKLDVSGIDFDNIIDLSPLYIMDDLTDLWLVDTMNLDATELNLLLDNLETIEGTSIEGVLHMTQADFDALNTAIGDLNHDNEVNGQDIDPFMDVLLAGQSDEQADMNGDGAVNGLDVAPLVAAAVSGGWLAAWDTEPGHHVEFLQLGDVNHDSEVNGLDVAPFVDVLVYGRFDVAADVNEDGFVNGLDVAPFVAAVIAGGGTQAVPEPSTAALATLAVLGLLSWRRKRR